MAMFRAFLLLGVHPKLTSTEIAIEMKPPEKAVETLGLPMESQNHRAGRERGGLLAQPSTEGRRSYTIPDEQLFKN